MRVIPTLIVVVLLAPLSEAQDVEDALATLASWTMLDVPSWSGLIRQDPLTDEIDAMMLRADNDAWLTCDTGQGSSSREPRLSLPGFPVLDGDTATVQFRIGGEAPRSEAWRISTGTGGSAVRVPDQHLECVLRAGRIAIQMQGHTREFEWESGHEVFVLLQGCAAEWFVAKDWLGR